MCVAVTSPCGRLPLALHQYNNYCYYYDYYVVVLLFFHTSRWQCVNVYEIIFLWATIASSPVSSLGPKHNYYGYGNLSVDITSSAGRLRCCQYISKTASSWGRSVKHSRNSCPTRTQPIDALFAFVPAPLFSLYTDLEHVGLSGSCLAGHKTWNTTRSQTRPTTTIYYVLAKGLAEQW